MDPAVPGADVPVPGRSSPAWTLPVPLRLLPVPGGATRARSGRDSAPPVPGGAAELGEGLCRYRSRCQPGGTGGEATGSGTRGWIPRTAAFRGRTGAAVTPRIPAGKTNPGKSRSSPVTRGDPERSARARAREFGGKAEPGEGRGDPGAGGTRSGRSLTGIPVNSRIFCSFGSRGSQRVGFNSSGGGIVSRSRFSLEGRSCVGVG